MAVTSPGAGTVAGSITVAADAFDEVGVVSVEFLLNGQPLGEADASAPYGADVEHGNRRQRRPRGDRRRERCRRERHHGRARRRNRRERTVVVRRSRKPSLFLRASEASPALTRRALATRAPTGERQLGRAPRVCESERGPLPASVSQAAQVITYEDRIRAPWKFT